MSSDGSGGSKDIRSSSETILGVLLEGAVWLTERFRTTARVATPVMFGDAFERCAGSAGGLEFEVEDAVEVKTSSLVPEDVLEGRGMPDGRARVVPEVLSKEPLDLRPVELFDVILSRWLVDDALSIGCLVTFIAGGNCP